MQFRLLYAGQLFSHRDGEQLKGRAHHVHDIRREFHRQLAKLWREHPVLAGEQYLKMPVLGPNPVSHFVREGFFFRPIVNEQIGLSCALDILMLRDGKPGRALADIDNRLKTIFDALRMPKVDEFGEGTKRGKITPQVDEQRAFYTVVEDDSLISHLSVTTDTLLDPVPNVAAENAVRLVIAVTVRPYSVTMRNLAFT